MVTSPLGPPCLLAQVAGPQWALKKSALIEFVSWRSQGRNHHRPVRNIQWLFQWVGKEPWTPLFSCNMQFYFWNNILALNGSRQWCRCTCHWSQFQGFSNVPCSPFCSTVAPAILVWDPYPHPIKTPILVIIAPKYKSHRSCSPHSSRYMVESQLLWLGSPTSYK
jgi:hypothetical protein